jgi:large subunit ribosomal protein L30
MLLDNFLGKKVVISQIRSQIKSSKKQKATLVGLGLRGIGSKSELDCSADVLGMIKKVAHLIKVS